MATTVELSGGLSDAGVPFADGKAMIWVGLANAPYIVDSTTSDLIVGRWPIEYDETGQFVRELPSSAVGAGYDPNGGFAFRFFAEYRDSAPKATRQTLVSAPFFMNADQTLAEALGGTIELSAVSEADRLDFQAKYEEALDARDVAVAAAAAAVAPTAEMVNDVLTDPTSDASVTLSATYARKLRIDPREFGTMDPAGVNESTAAFLAALDYLYANGGGTLAMPLGQFRVDDVVHPATDGLTPAKQANVRITGVAGHSGSRNQKTPVGGTVLDLRASDTYGKIKTNGNGLLYLDHLIFKDTAGTTTPWIYDTNTTIMVRDNAFVGTKSGVNCDQDAIVLGGTQQVEGGTGWDDGFQGYGTIIERNLFAGVRRCVLSRVYANGNRIRNNNVMTSCGSNLAGGAAFEFDGNPNGGAGQKLAGGSISENLIETNGYAYGIKARNTVGLSILSNDGYDAASPTVAMVLLEDTAVECNVVAGYWGSGSRPYLIDQNGLNRFTEINASGYRSIEARPKTFRADVRAAGNGGVGVQAIDTAGNAAYIKAVAPTAGVYPYARLVLSTRGATQVTDGVTTSGSRTVTSATLAAGTVDKDIAISASGVPSGSYITKVVNATTVEISQPATITATGVTLTFGRFQAEQQHVGVERGHLVGLPQGTSPSINPGAASGTGPTIAISGTDLAGSITLTVGTSPTTGILGTIANAINYSGTQRPVLTPCNAASAALQVWADRTGAGAWNFGCVVAPAPGAVLKFTYVAVQAL